MYWKKITISVLFIAIIAILTFFFDINIFRNSLVGDTRMLLLLYIINYYPICGIFGLTIIYADIMDKGVADRKEQVYHDDLPELTHPSKYVLRYGREEIEFTQYNQDIVHRLWEEMWLNTERR